MAVNVARADLAYSFSETEYTTPREVRLDEARREKASKDRTSMLRIAVALIIGIFILLGMRVYCASIQHANNVLAQENAYLKAEIDSLNSQLVEETKVTKIEEVARDKYGMVFPSSENCVNLGDTKGDSEESLAATIKSEAYK